MDSVAQVTFDFDRIDRRTRQVTPSLIAAVVDRIVAHVHPEQVVLFGSQAREKAVGGSDIDLLVIISGEHPWATLPRRERCGHLLHLFRYRFFGLDAIVLTEAEVQHIHDTNEGEWDLILEILAEGKTLHARVEEAPAE